MIIDFHSHLGLHSLYPSQFLTSMITGDGLSVSQDNLYRLLKSILKDKDGSLFLREMDRNNIEKAVLLIIDAGFGYKNSSLSIEEIYEIHHNILRKYPDRFVVFAGIDPRRENEGIKLFKKAIFEYGFKGLKLYPTFGFLINDYRLDDYYKICEENQLPVLVHTDNKPEDTNRYWSNPLAVLEMASKYTNVKFILAHVGCVYQKELYYQVANRSNVYLDFSGIQGRMVKDENILNIQVQKFIETNIVDKVLFGTDWPLFNLFKRLSVDIEKIKTQVLMNYLPSIFDQLFYQNAKRLLSI